MYQMCAPMLCMQVALAPQKHPTWAAGYKNATGISDGYNKIASLLPTRSQRADASSSSSWSRAPAIEAHPDNPLYQYFLSKKSGPLIHKWVRLAHVSSHALSDSHAQFPKWYVKWVSRHRSSV